MRDTRDMLRGGAMGGLGPGGSGGCTFFPPFLDFICTPCAHALPRRQSPKFFAQGPDRGGVSSGGAGVGWEGVWWLRVTS